MPNRFKAKRVLEHWTCLDLLHDRQPVFRKCPSPLSGLALSLTGFSVPLDESAECMIPKLMFGGSLNVFFPASLNTIALFLVHPLGHILPNFIATNHDGTSRGYF